MSLNFNVSKKHFVELINNYSGKIVLINLIDRKKEGTDQKIIGELYHKCLKESNIPRIDFTWFDFHEECKKMKYENISKMLKTSSVSGGLSNFGYTHIIAKSGFSFDKLERTPSEVSGLFTILSKQEGVFRTNCIDCLDRTNVIQSVLARQVLHKVLNKLGFEDVPSGEVFEVFLHEFESKYKEVWADNGDHLSIAYTGTNAMKGDFTRIGKKTKKGSLIDGKLACQRYYLNGFVDGYHQDCHDLFLGNFIYYKTY